MQKNVAPKDNNQIFLDAINDLHGYRELIARISESNQILAESMAKKDALNIELHNELAEGRERFDSLLETIRKSKSLPDLRDKVAAFIIE